MKPGPIVLCSSCGEKVRRSTAWQLFRLLRHLGTPGGGRQKTLAGRGDDTYFCNPCARRADEKVRGIAESASLFGETRSMEQREASTTADGEDEELAAAVELVERELGGVVVWSGPRGESP